MPARALLNGEPASKSAFSDRACHFGDGLFETLAVREGRPCLWQWHWDRLRTGCERLGLSAPARDLIEKEVLALCNDQPRGVLKIMLTAGAAGTGYVRDQNASVSRWIRVAPWPDIHPWSTETPLTARVCELRLASQPQLAGIKHLNRLEQVLARNELPKAVDEGIVCDSRGRVVEGISANLFARIGNTFVTPRIVDCGVAGTVRHQILERGRACGIEVAETQLDLEALQHADAVYVTNALLGIRPLARIDDRELPIQRRSAELERLHASCFTYSGEVRCND